MRLTTKRQRVRPKPTMRILLSLSCLSSTLSFYLRQSRPIIGILSQPRFDNSSDYIAASYVKWLEAAGAASIVVPYEADPLLMDEIFDEINGLLLPGGSAAYPPHLSELLDTITYENLWNDDYLPVWGTCLGFEFLVEYIGGSGALQDGFQAENISLPLEQVASRELYATPLQQKRIRENITMNNHHQGIEPDHFRENTHLIDAFVITSINHDSNGRPFVSTIEPVNPEAFGFYGVQYHPEKNAFEYATYPNSSIPYEAINHSESAVGFALELARFFVSKARINKHQYTGKFPLIANTYPIEEGRKFEEIFIIPKDVYGRGESEAKESVAES